MKIFSKLRENKLIISWLFYYINQVYKTMASEKHFGNETGIIRK